MSHLNLLTIRLAEQDTPADTTLRAGSWLLTSLTRIREDVVLVVAADELKKDASLGHLFTDLSPRPEGSFQIELGLILPGWLPSPPHVQDWTVSVDIGLGASESLALCFSNQMLRYRYTDSEFSRQVVVPSFAVKKSLEEARIPPGCPAEVLRTMVTCRFHLAGQDLESAVEDGLDAIADSFLDAINRVIYAYLLLVKPERPLLFFAVDRSSAEYVYLLIQGGDEKKVGVYRVALSGYRVMRVPGELSVEEQEGFLRHLNDSSGEKLAHRFLSAGLTSIESGLLEVALLQLVIAGELATTHATTMLLASHEVSRTKRDRFGQHLTYSELLNVLLVSLSPPGQKPNTEVIGILNWGRDARNDLMHQGIFAASREQLRKLFTATAQHLEYLAEITPRAGTA